MLLTADFLVAIGIKNFRKTIKQIYWSPTTLNI